MIPPASCGMNDTKLELRENEEAELSDIDDDVFVRGRRNGFRLELYDNAKKPLMAPRKKQRDYGKLRNGDLHTEIRSSPPSLRVLCIPICYVLIASFAMLGIIALIAILFHYVSLPVSFLNLWKSSSERRHGTLLPCDTFKVEDVWVRNFPMLLTNSAFRMVDINGDGVDDIILGFATGVDGYDVPEIVCDIYFSGQKPCFGGILALNGRDGSEIWRHWTSHEVFALNCNEDVSLDGVQDCLFGGKAGVFGAVSGKDGEVLWNFPDSPPKNPLMNVYTPQFIRDVNEDSIPDILTIHGGDHFANPGNQNQVSSRILVVSGKDGKILEWMKMPDEAQSYYSSQILTSSDGADYVIVGTGDETHPGGLYIIPLHDITNGNTKNARRIYADKQKGLIATPVLVDINSDGVEDIVIPTFNSTVIAFDGLSFSQIWNFTFPSSESYMTPTPGYFNEDNVPDFLVKYQTGPGFPIYYQAQATVLNGRTGESFLERPLLETVGSQVSTPLIRVQGYGNDIFLFWTSNCAGLHKNGSEFTFKKGTTIREQSRANLCKLRFGSRLINQLHAFNRETGLPGALIYDSESRRESEEAGAVNTSALGQKYLNEHPNLGWKEEGQLSSTSLYGREMSHVPVDAESPNYREEYGQEYREAEVPLDLAYPGSHSVRKHGGLLYPPPVPIWPNYDDRNEVLEDFGRNMGGEEDGRVWEEGRTGRRSKRRLDQDDANRIHHLISTGTLGKPLWTEDGIDLIFGTYWFYPAPTTLLLPQTQKCIDEKMNLEGRRFEESSSFFGMDHDLYEETVTKDCLHTHEPNDKQIYESAESTFDPFNIPMGQMSVYRLHVSCSCAQESASAQKGRRCGRIRPLEEQPWTGHMGSAADSHFRTKNGFDT